MHLHILGICGTFMGGVALLARALGHRVTGSDANVYPPMSTQLEAAGIELMQGYEAEHLRPAPDVVVVGNAMKRGIPAVEFMLDAGLRYVSGPQWLAEHLLADRHVLAVAGTHGKTTTSSMLAWILEHAGLDPGFLIGGVPMDFGISARLGGGRYFVVEADEYDTAFFDKRSKFVHYRPRTLVMNNLEFDHADIFANLGEIERQFHHLVRTVPGAGLIVQPRGDAALERVLAQGCWTPVEMTDADSVWSFRSVDGDFSNALPGNALLHAKVNQPPDESSDPDTRSPRENSTVVLSADNQSAADPSMEAAWQATLLSEDASAFQVLHRSEPIGEVHWSQTGQHNLANGLAAIAAAAHVGVAPCDACAALSAFAGVKRRMELRGEVDGVRVYDDFAHHPTAIATTLAGLRRHVGDARILAVLEPRSNTMRMGIHAESMAGALADADRVYVYASPDLGWDAGAALGTLADRLWIAEDINALVKRLAADAQSGDQLLVMSNGGFGGIHQRLLDALGARDASAGKGSGSVD